MKNDTKDEVRERLLKSLAKENNSVLMQAYFYAINLDLYGVDVREKWETAIQQSEALEKAYTKGRKWGINMTKMRVCYYILGTKPYYKEVTSVEEAKTVIDAISDFINAKVEEGVFPDHCSTTELEEYNEEEKEWMTWYDENGLDFNEWEAENED